MNKKFIEREKTFNQKEYNTEYRKKHYKQFAVNISIEFYEQIENYCRDNNLTKADFLRNAAYEFMNK